MDVQHPDQLPGSPERPLLCADAGRPDMTELSRVVGRAVAEGLGLPLEAYGPPDMGSPRRTTSVPRGAVELVPGDLEGLREAARALRAADPADGASLSIVAAEAAAAHDALAEALAPLRASAEEAFARSEALGTGEALLADPEAVRSAVDAGGPTGAAVAELVQEMAELRLRWDGAQIDFFEGLSTSRSLLGIPSW